LYFCFLTVGLDLDETVLEPGVLPLQLEDGILIPPRENEQIILDELEELCKQPDEMKEEFLWSLLCCLVNEDFETNVKTKGVSMTKGDQ
jgi:hypothetical protein